MENLNVQSFKEKVFDFQANKEWKFAGSKPCIVDFYAQWCGPCKMLGPVLAEVAAEQAGKMDVYKVDIDAEPELAVAFGIQSVPTILFIPAEGKPAVARGALPKAQINQIIKETLGVG